MKITQDSQTNASTELASGRPEILVFTACYLPGYRGGGPIRSVANMVERLSDSFDFRVVTMDRDLHDQGPYQCVNVDAWNTVGKAQVFYASPSMQTLRGMIRLLRDTPYDLLYLNSFFNATFTLRPLLARRLSLVPHRPTVLAPRGEFSDGAFKLKIWKKAPFIRLARLVNLYSGITWHASTEFEALDIQLVFGESAFDIKVASNVAIAPDLLDNYSVHSSFDEEDISTDNRVLRVCFLSRISPKKNLDFALKVLASVNVPVQFTIYGPQEDPAYWQICLDLVAKMPQHIKVSYMGSIQHDRVRAVLAKHDVFFVPTLGENFGHVFLEAWSAGVPILVSDQTPWLGLEQQQLGWDIPLANPEEFVCALETAASLDAGQRAQMSRRCLEFAREKSEDTQALESNRRLFSLALGANAAKLVF